MGEKKDERGNHKWGLGGVGGGFERDGSRQGLIEDGRQRRDLFLRRRE